MPRSRWRFHGTLIFGFRELVIVYTTLAAAWGLTISDVGKLVCSQEGVRVIGWMMAVVASNAKSIEHCFEQVKDKEKYMMNMGLKARLSWRNRRWGFWKLFPEVCR